MNKKKVNAQVKIAYDVLVETAYCSKPGENKVPDNVKSIVINNTVSKTFLGYISTFGAAINMGSLLPAIAFFSEKGESKESRPLLLDAILKILQKENIASQDDKTLFEFASKNGDIAKNAIIDASIALKLAMKLFERPESEKKDDETVNAEEASEEGDEAKDEV